VKVVFRFVYFRGSICLLAKKPAQENKKLSVLLRRFGRINLTEKSGHVSTLPASPCCFPAVAAFSSLTFESM